MAKGMVKIKSALEARDSAQRFTCDICGRFFANKFSMVMHRNWHTRRERGTTNTHTKRPRLPRIVTPLAREVPAIVLHAKYCPNCGLDIHAVNIAMNMMGKEL